MSTKVKEALFELIKSLSKSEKRYFKLQSSIHTIGEENNYVRLFDYIDKMEMYDEELLFGNFKGEAFLNRFSITKKRLYDHILDALDSFHAGNSIDAQLGKMIHSADILYNKSLYEQCVRVLRSAEKLADKHERSIALLEINRRLRKLIENTGYASVPESQLNDIFRVEKSILNRVSVHNELWQIKSELFVKLSAKGQPRSKEDLMFFQNLMTRISNVNIEDNLPFETQFLFNHIHSAYFFLIGQLTESQHYLDKNLRLFESNETNIKENLNSYFSLLTNFIYVAEKLELTSKTNELIKKLKSIPEKYDEIQSEDQQIKFFSSANSIELSILINRADFETCLKLIPQIEVSLLMYGSKLAKARKAYIEFKIATIFLSTGNPTMALKWVNSILNEVEMDKNEDIFGYAQLVDLLIHLELKNTQLLPYSLKNTQRYLKARNRIHSFEKLFLNFVSKRIKTSNLFDAELLWEELFISLDELEGDQFERIALEFFDFRTWAEAKMKRMSFIDLINQKRQSKLLSNRKIA